MAKRTKSRPKEQMSREREGEGNQYDRILKEALRHGMPTLIFKILGLPYGHYRSVHVELQRTLERRADFITEVKATDGVEYIIHIEVQAANDAKMIYRELMYSALILNQYPDHTVLQYVLYLGKESPQMLTSLKNRNINFQFHLIWIKDIPYESFLNTEEPDLILLAVLANYRGKTVSV
jgi:uncharacterized radical SAM superfamily protein